jgi:hypothetical protein
MGFSYESKSVHDVTTISLLRSTGCPKCLEPMGILLIFIYRLKVKRQKEKGINIGRKGGDFAFWGFLRHLSQRITDCCAIVDPNMLSKIRTNMVKRLRECVECLDE